MADVLLRDLEQPVVTQLKKRAKRNGRSLQAELRVILSSAAAETERHASFDEAVAFAAKMRRKYAGKISGDSADIIREWRDR